MRIMQSGLVAALTMLVAGAAHAQVAALDGTYRPPTGGAPGNSACGTTVFGYPIRVKDGAAAMQTVSAGLLEGKIAPDGSLTITAGRATLTGKFAGGHFTGSYSVGNCMFTMQYDRR
ncbi:MAG: hypothetical protein NVSMB18_08220 [Acetobacteraceae bacterium]